MKIGLMGFEFSSANKGCEALVYSFLNIIENELNEISVIYNFSNTPLGEVKKYFPKLHFKQIIPRLRDLKFSYLKALKACDIIFDVTMGDSFSDIYSLSYYNNLIKQKKIAEILCKKYILLPQTYGPFEYTSSAEKAKLIFNSASRIYCRDEISKQLLQDKFGIHDAILMSDMAFVLPYDKSLYSFSKLPKIGINVSGLLYKGGFHSENQFGLTLNYKELIEKMIGELSKNFEVHLIPHVIDLHDNAYDDDYKVCKKLSEKFQTTVLAPAFNTPIQAKSYISNMEIFIGSRMHSTIASFSAGVVTIPISYSRKFEGLFGSLDYPYVVNAKKESTESAYEMVMQYIKNKAELVVAQNISMKILEEKNLKFKKSVLELLKEK